MIIIAKKFVFLPGLAEAEWGNVILGSMLSFSLPDIDHPKSFISRRFKISSFITSHILTHRGFTHSILSVVLFSLLINNCLKEASIINKGLHDSMIIGYISHLIADMFTKSGIQLFWPYRMRFSFPILSPNTPLKEGFFCVLILIFAIIIPNR
ncbi:hypothetical protein G653_03947 [Candidatus Liberibacter americanus PW_SP]|nr:hypothetical protein G653_03947 [Candidatus Liberibacter americanus PW_SP]